MLSIADEQGPSTHVQDWFVRARNRADGTQLLHDACDGDNERFANLASPRAARSSSDVKVHESRAVVCRPRVRCLVFRCIVDFVADGFDRRQELLEAELRRYFGEKCAALVARWQAAITGLAPLFLRELGARLRELDEVMQETNRQLRLTLCLAAESASTEPIIDQALTSLEHLNEIAEFNDAATG
jgi:hypothetical protein